MNYYKENKGILKAKLEACREFDINKIVSKIKHSAICIGSGASFATAYFCSRVLNEIYKIDSLSLTPRQLLNSTLNKKVTIIIFSYSGTSKDTLYIQSKYKNTILICGRNKTEFTNHKNIFSYYTGFPYERGLILYENLFVPATIFLNSTDNKKIIDYEIKQFDKRNFNIGNIKKIAIFTGDYCCSAVYDFKEKLLENYVLEFDIFDKKDFSHGQYNYFVHTNYDLILYLKQKKVSEYEKKLLTYLNNSNKVLVLESKYNGIQAEYDLLYIINDLYNSLIENKKIDYYSIETKELYEFGSDFS